MSAEIDIYFVALSHLLQNVARWQYESSPTTTETRQNTGKCILSTNTYKLDSTNFSRLLWGDHSFFEQSGLNVRVSRLRGQMRTNLSTIVQRHSIVVAAK